MKFYGSRHVLPVVVLGFAASVLFGQSKASGGSVAGPAEDMHGLTVRELHPRATPTPFPLDISAGRAQALEFRTPEKMSDADKNLVIAHEAEIARRAELQGFGLGMASQQSKEWGYEQAVCPVFPDHVILEYSRNNGAGDVTLFAVAIPRGDGHVRVIPVRRRGYSLFTPAASNALTLNDFNHIVAEEHHGISPDWLSLGLCYSALAGGHVRAALQVGLPEEERYPLFSPAKLAVSGKGGAVVHFADTTPQVTGMDWVLTFAQDGRLLKVRHTVSAALQERPVPGRVMEVKGVPTKESAIEVSGPGK